MQPSFETLQEILRACGFDLQTTLVPYEADPNAGRASRESAAEVAPGALAGDAESSGALMSAREPFDPIAILQALDSHRVSYIVIGALGRVIHGSDELTDGIDIVPSLRDENVRRLGLALADVDARLADGTAPRLDRDLGQPVLELRTDAGELTLVPEPAGTRGYDDLRRGSAREPLGRGVRPSVASLGDHARMLAALDREQDRERLGTIRRLIELDRSRIHSRGLSIER